MYVTKTEFNFVDTLETEIAELRPAALTRFRPPGQGDPIFFNRGSRQGRAGRQPSDA
jgi:hypothetical protein